MNEKQYRVSALVIENSGILESYREAVIGCIIFDTKTCTSYRLDDKVAEYYLSEVLKRKHSLSEILDCKEIERAINNYSILKVDEQRCRNVYGAFDKINDIGYSELDKIAENTEPIWSYRKALEDLNWVKLIAVINSIIAMSVLIYTIVNL